MRSFKYVLAFTSGFLVFLGLCFAAALIITIVLDSSGSNSFSLGEGILTVYKFERSSKSFSFALKGGIIFVAIGGGLLNCALLWLFHQWKKKAEI